MKKSFLFIVALSLTCTINAQTYKTSLNVTHNTSGSSVMDVIPFEGGEIVILGNTVSINFAETPTANCSYAFDNVSSLSFLTKDITAVDNPVAKEGLSIFVDRAREILQLHSNVSLGKISIWSLSGNLLTNREIIGNEDEINIASFAKGVYIVQSGAFRVKFVK